MMRARVSLLLAGVLVLVSATQSVGGSLCRPLLIVKAVGFSEISPAQREWKAKFAVDAFRCAATSGRFAIDFVRIKEAAPDLRFTEWFTWRPGQVDVSTGFAADEAVLDYAISDVAPCPCRE
jgi:hypothetical protein